MKKDDRILMLAHWLSRWILFPLFFYLIRYRRKIVRENLQMAFPEQSTSERYTTQRLFYLYFSDMIMEIFCGRLLSNEQLSAHVKINDLDRVTGCIKQYGGGFCMLGHFINWEWIADYANQFAVHGVQGCTVYKRLSSKFFDRLMHRLRERSGGRLVEMNSLLRVMVANQRQAEPIPFCYAMLADQRPRHNATQHRTTLLNREVGVLMGSEQLARRFDLPVFYTYITSSKRGYYELSFTQIYDPSAESDLPEGAITERFTRLLEDNIRTTPARWLWTHRRFAGSRPAESGE